MEHRLNRHRRRGALVGLVFLCLSADPAMAWGDRQALIIGNSTYPDSPLNNPGRDADGMAEQLRELGFDVVLGKDLDRDAMDRAIDDFVETLDEDSLALFFYAGHGFQSKDKQQNHLVPISRLSQWPSRGISVNSILAKLEGSKSRANIVILDACRNTGPLNGAPRSLTSPILERSFSASDNPQPSGTVIVYATAAGAEAWDGAGKNGEFTGAFLEQLRIPGLSLYEVVKNTIGQVRDRTGGKQVPRFVSSLDSSIFLHPKSPRHCLELLDDAPSERADMRLGRVVWNDQIYEPVPVWSTDDGYRFRSCATGEPVEIETTEAEWFDSALVARFQNQEANRVALYDEFGGAGYAPDSEAEMTLDSADRLLEARRQSSDFVEVVGPDSVGIVRNHESILLVASRGSLEQVELDTWDGSWGEKPRDSRIGREIIWWQMLRDETLVVHPAVWSFSELAELVEQSPETGVEGVAWESTMEQHGEAILPRFAYALMVVEAVEHIALTERLQQAAEAASNGSPLDVAKLEQRRKRDRWDEDDVERLEATLSRGRFWLLGRYSDLAAFLPGRIAGRVRLEFLKSHPELGKGDAFLSEIVYLPAVSPHFQLGNAFYRDQIPALIPRASFLQCLLDDESYGSPELNDVLNAGLEKMGIESVVWAEMTDVRQAFRTLFQGFDLPADLPGARHLVASSIRLQTPQLQRLVNALHASLMLSQSEPQGEPLGESESGEQTAAVEERAVSPACRIDLIPDAVIAGGRGMEIPERFDALKIFREGAVDVLAVQGVLDARAAARDVLKNLVHLKGARHTRRLMERGYTAFDRGDALLDSLGAETDEVASLLAIEAFEEAKRLFDRARERASQIEYAKPKVRVH